MDRFKWPDHIEFDDTEEDVREARKVWFEAHARDDGGVIQDFMEFMQAYAQGLESRRNKEDGSTESA